MADTNKPVKADPTSPMTRSEVETIAQRAAEQGTLASMVCDRVLSSLAGSECSLPIAQEMMARTMKDVAPTSYVEQMLAEQLVMTHAQVIELHRIAKTADHYESKEMLYGMVAKMQGEFRKTVNTLRDLRSPRLPSIRANQANIAGQQVVLQPGDAHGG